MAREQYPSSPERAVQSDMSSTIDDKIAEAVRTGDYTEEQVREIARLLLLEHFGERSISPAQPQDSR